MASTRCRFVLAGAGLLVALTLLGLLVVGACPDGLVRDGEGIPNKGPWSESQDADRSKPDGQPADGQQGGGQQPDDSRQPGDEQRLGDGQPEGGQQPADGQPSPESVQGGGADRSRPDAYLEQWEGGSRWSKSSVDKSLSQAATSLLEGYRDEADCVLCRAGYVDLFQNVWACVVQGPDWVDLCVVSQTEDGGRSEVWTMRMEVEEWSTEEWGAEDAEF